MRLKNRVALITGGGGDVAIAIASKFIENGAKVVLVDRDEKLLQTASQTINAGDNLHVSVGDVCSLEHQERTVEVASNNPPAEPEAFKCEPLKAAGRGR